MSSHRSLPLRGEISLASSLVPQDQEYPDDHPSFPASSLSSSTRRRKRTAKKGDIVTVQLHMELDPDYAIEPLFDLHGQHSFLLGYGNYLPDLHKLLLQQPEGSSLTNVSIDAGWGVVNSDLMATLTPSQFSDPTIAEPDATKQTQINRQNGNLGRRTWDSLGWE